MENEDRYQFITSILNHEMKKSLILRNKAILNRFAKVDRWVLSLYLLIYFSEQEEQKIRYKPILQVMLTPGWLPSVTDCLYFQKLGTDSGERQGYG